MTRINLVEPEELSNQHLVAEYREIFMVGSALQRSLKSKQWTKTQNELPSEFTLNKGHVKFFYNKGAYLHKRYKSIVKEMQRRGMNPDPNRKFKVNQFPKEYYNNWEPNKEDLHIIRKRIEEKIAIKPHWYKWG
tara:strand:- start:194 stop:595 length:402 start_codon:yes stop_codon:yes gene_type:complete